MRSTKLSAILNRMNRYTTIYPIEEQYKVRDIDEAIRAIKRTTQLPWELKKSTLRIFNGVLEYPVATDHDELAYLDTPKHKLWNDNANFFYTSLQQFYENANDRNSICEIWDQGTKFLGVRYESNYNSAAGVLLDTGKAVSNYVASGDASSISLDNVNFLEDNSSIKFVVVNNTNVATVSATFSSLSLTNYQRSYAFYNVFLGGSTAPTSINLRFGNDSSNYAYGTVTTQFSGQSLKVNDWNLVAFDLNNPTGVVGTLNSSNFDYYAVSMIDAPTGTYYLDNCYAREWNLLDYWYYSTYAVVGSGSLIPSKAAFITESSNSYDLEDALTGDDEWADVIMYDAIKTGVVDKENDKVYEDILAKRDTAWNNLLQNYPSMKPLIMTNKYNFETDYRYTNSGSF